jgi:hypothetical protein
VAGCLFDGYDARWNALLQGANCVGESDDLFLEPDDEFPRRTRLTPTVFFWIVGSQGTQVVAVASWPIHALLSVQWRNAPLIA